MGAVNYEKLKVAFFDSISLQYSLLFVANPKDDNRIFLFRKKYNKREYLLDAPLYFFMNEFITFWVLASIQDFFMKIIEEP